MKKNLFLIFCAFLSISTIARDFDYTYNGTRLTYTVIDEKAKTCQLKAGEIGFSGPKAGNYANGELVIPSQVSDGKTIYTVTSIGKYAFYELNLSTVSIPQSVETIASHAFEWCTGLRTVYIPDGVTTIGSDAFRYCSSLTSVSIPQSVTCIGGGAFLDCSSLGKAEFASIEALCKIIFEGYNANPLETAHHLFIDGKEVIEVIIPPEVTSIGDFSFIGCRSLISVTIPEGVTSIGSYAFSDCRSLTSVTIPESLTTIGSEAFTACTSLPSVSIPGSVTTIGSGAFSFCLRLKKAKFASIEALCKINFGSGSANPLTYADHLVIDGKEINDVIILPSVSSIGDYAFYGYDSLTTVTIPRSVTSIGSGAFSWCKGLTSISIPGRVATIGSESFSNCSGLTSVTISEGVKAIDSYAFSDCVSLTSLTIPESVTIIGVRAFAKCSNLPSVTIPKDVTKIGSHAFDNCSSLTKIYYGADKPISVDWEIFPYETYGRATLYMSNSGRIYSAWINPWKNFKHIIKYDFNGIDDVEADFDENTPCEFYNLNGVKVATDADNLNPGLYIRRQGNSINKVVVK